MTLCVICAPGRWVVMLSLPMPWLLPMIPLAVAGDVVREHEALCHAVRDLDESDEAR
jgi:hypothetical protein